MATYNSITNKVVAPPVPAGSIAFSSGTCSQIDYAAQLWDSTVPNGEVRSYTPSITREWRSDPTKAERRNWARIKKSGAISMTPLSVGKETVTQYVVAQSRYWPINPWNWGYCPTGTQYIRKEHGYRRSTWTQNDHLGSLSGLSTANASSSKLRQYEDEISSAIASTQSAAFASSLSSYDVLTEIAEAKETLHFLNGKVQEAADALRKFAHADEPTHRRARGLTAKQLIGSSDKALRRIGSRWMEYRYAIMPIVYSIKDINELLGSRSAVYKTDRDRSNIDISIEMPSDLSGKRIIYLTGSLKAEVRSTVKSAYNRGALQRVLSLTSFNPFKTAWELIPYSFVVDWFVNVGDVITSQTSLDLSSQKACCTSVRRTRTIQTRLHDSSQIVWTMTRPPATYGGPNVVFTENETRSTDGLLQEVSYESYDRFLWSKPEPKLSFDPFLNWKRALDAIVLGYQPTKKLLRSL